MKVTRFIFAYFKQIPSVILASTMATLAMTFMVILSMYLLEGRLGDGVFLMPFLFWGFGHVLAAPGLLLAYIPISIFLKNKKCGFWSYVLYATFCSFLNVLLLFPLVDLRGILALFLGTGFLTGVCHFLIVYRGNDKIEIPKSGRVLVVLVVLGPIIYWAYSLLPISPCSKDITTQVAGVKLQVPRFYSYEKQKKKSTGTRWKAAADFIQPEGGTFWPRVEDQCEKKELIDRSMLKVGYASYFDPEMYGNVHKNWIDRRISEILSIGGVIDIHSNDLQVFRDTEAEKNYMVLPLSAAKTKNNKPLIFVCDEQKDQRSCYASYENSYGLITSYDLPSGNYDKNTLIEINAAVQKQLDEFVISAQNPEIKNARFLLPKKLHNYDFGLSSHGIRCDGYKKVSKETRRNLTVKIANSYFRILNKHDVFGSTIAIGTSNLKSIRDLPCDVDYIDGVSFGIRDEGAIAEINTWVERQSKLRYGAFYENKENLEQAAEVEGIKEIRTGRDNAYRYVLLSNDLVPSGPQLQARVACSETFTRYGCSITYQKKGHDFVVSYNKKYNSEIVENPDYVSLFNEAEAWVAEMRDAAEKYKDKTGYH